MDSIMDTTRRQRFVHNIGRIFKHILEFLGLESGHIALEARFWNKILQILLYSGGIIVFSHSTHAVCCGIFIRPFTME